MHVLQHNAPPPPSTPHTYRSDPTPTQSYPDPPWTPLPHHHPWPLEQHPLSHWTRALRRGACPLAGGGGGCGLLGLQLGARAAIVACLAADCAGLGLSRGGGTNARLLLSTRIHLLHALRYPPARPRHTSSPHPFLGVLLRRPSAISRLNTPGCMYVYMLPLRLNLHCPPPRTPHGLAGTHGTPLGPLALRRILIFRPEGRSMRPPQSRDSLGSRFPPPFGPSNSLPLITDLAGLRKREWTQHIAR